MDDQSRRIEVIEQRIAALEAEIARLRAGDPATFVTPVVDGTPSAADPHGTEALPPPMAPPTEAGHTATASSAPAVPARFTIDTEAALKWGGVGLVVLAVAFALSTAIRRGWIGPELQLAGALALSAALIVIGLRLRSTRRGWTHALVSGGVAALLTTFASDLFIDELSDDVAAVATLVVGFGAIALARSVPSEWVGAVAVAGSVVGWLVVFDGSPPFGASAAAFVVMIAVVTFVAVTTRWYGVRLLLDLVGVVCVVAFAAGAEEALQQAIALVAATQVALLLSVVASVDPPGPDTSGAFWWRAGLQVPTVLAPWTFVVLAVVFVENTDIDVDAGWLALGAALGVAALATALRTRNEAAHFVAMLVGASVSLTIGFGLLLDTDTTFVAIALQGAGLLALAARIDKPLLAQLNAAVLLFVAGAYVLAVGIEAWEVDASLGEDIARGAVIATLGAAVRSIRQVDVRRLGALVVLLLTMVWVGAVLVHLPQGQAAVSLTWSVIGGALLVVGAVRKLPGVGRTGLAVLGVTVAKLLLVDMAEVDALWRAGLFLVVGLAFMRLGFLLPRWTGADMAPGRDDVDGSMEHALRG